jgi:serine palmitoyltransferase
VPTIHGGLSPRPRISLPGSPDKTREVLNLASYNFADLAGSKEVEEAAIRTLREYGVGSCSPPGFYGTIGECAGGKGRRGRAATS